MIAICVDILIFVGLFFFLAASVGVLRFPDVYCRLHASSKSDTLASFLMLSGVALYVFFEGGGLQNALKILLIVVFICISSPTIAHTIARRAHRNGLKPWTEDDFLKEVEEKGAK